MSADWKGVRSRASRIGFPLVLLFFLAAVACANRSPVAVSPTTVEPPGGDVPAVDWNNPMQGVKVESVDEAAKAVSFDIHIPEGLDGLAGIFVTGAQVPRESAAVEFVYDDSTFGRVVTFQRPPDIPVEEYDAANQQIVDTFSGPGTAEIVTIRGGERGLLGCDPSGSCGIYWLEKGIEFWVGGPSLSRSEVLSISETL